MNNGKIELEISTEITKASVTEDDGYLLVTFQDDTDDALSEKQVIKIHQVDFNEFVDMLNEAALLLMGRK